MADRKSLIRTSTSICRARLSQQGFAATSTDELMRAMNISRQSMYDTFGDKRALYLKALDMYVTESVEAIGVEPMKPGPAIAAIRNALVKFSERKDLASSDGCKGLNAISEFGQRDAEVSRIAWNAARKQRLTLRILDKAVEGGEIGAGTNVNSMADFFESTLAGIRMAAKAGKSRTALRNIAIFAGRAYLRLSQ